MSGTSKDKSKKIIIRILKFLLVAASWTFVSYKIYTAPDIMSLGQYFADISFNKSVILIIIFLLMFLNWGLETIKWRYLISGLEDLSFFKSFKAVWSGVTAGLITPNRIGEFGGRILFLKGENRKKASVLTLYGDLAQMIATLVAGIAGFYYIYVLFSKTNTSISEIKSIVFSLSLILITFCITAFLCVNRIFSKLSRNKTFAKHLTSWLPDAKINLLSKTVVLFFSFLRYLVFCIQFYLSLRFFDINVGFVESFAAIAAMYLATHIIPSIAMAEIGIRLSFSVLFIGLFSEKTMAISLASLMIYLVNIAIPALIGGLFIFKGNRKAK